MIKKQIKILRTIKDRVLEKVRQISRLARGLRFKHRHDRDSQHTANPILHKLKSGLPSVAVVLLLTTLVVYLTTGPEAAAPSGNLDADLTDPATSQTTVPWSAFEPDFTEYEDYNRGSYQYPETTAVASALPSGSPSGTSGSDVAGVLDVDAEITPDAEPTLSPTPDATPTAVPSPTKKPLEKDAYGVIQEPLDPASFEAVEQTVYVKAYHANLRQKPRTDADIIAAVEMGDILVCTGEGLYWSEVRTVNGEQGYIYSALISSEIIYKPAVTSVPEPDPSPTTPPKATATPKPTAKPEPTATPKPTAKPEPTATPKPTAKPEPTATPKPIESSDTSSGMTAAQQKQVVSLAKSLLGVRYVYGGASPSGLDCSGLTTYIYKEIFSVTLPRTARDQAKAGKSVSKDNIRIGDIICFDWSSPKGVCDHVGIYIGNGQYIHASYSRGRVVESTVNFSRNPIISIRRIIN